MCVLANDRSRRPVGERRARFTTDADPLAAVQAQPDTSAKRKLFACRHNVGFWFNPGPTAPIFFPFASGRLMQH